MLTQAQIRRKNLDGAIEVFTSASHREAQAARALWKKGCLLKELGNDLTSKELLRKAMELRRELKSNENRPVEELADEDWTQLVFYWSR